jgi:hypothetical protein
VSRSAPAARGSALRHFLQDHVSRLGHHLLHDFLERLAALFELGHQHRQDGEVALFGVGAHVGEPPIHCLHEAAMRRDDLAVEVVLQRTPTHARSIESPPARFNGMAFVIACALAAATIAGAVEVPGSAGRLSLDGYVDGLGVVDTGGAPHQRPEGLLDLGLDATVTRWLRGHLELRGAVGGPFEGAHAGILDLGHAFQNHSPSIEASEAFADIRTDRADFRLGVQKIVWGKLDGMPPTDVVNPHDYHDPIVGDFEERKIGIPALLGTYYLPDVARFELSNLRATLVWVPVAVPARLALRDERWFPHSITPPTSFTVTAESLADAGLPRGRDLHIPIRLGTVNHHPPRRFDDGGVAFRLGGAFREIDWDLYHYTGPETGPDADLIVEVRRLGPNLLPLVIESDLTQARDVIHMTGADGAVVLGGLTVRAEAAHFIGRPYLRRAGDLVNEASHLPVGSLVRALGMRRRVRLSLGDLFPTFDSVEWGVGGDYLIDGWQPLLQLNQIVILDPAPNLLIADPETRVVATLRKRFFSDRLELEARGTYAIERGAWFLFPRASYTVRDDLRVRVGYLAIGGPRTSLLGQFGKNDEVVFQARYTF